jgi:hypothetical protein
VCNTCKQKPSTAPRVIGRGNSVEGGLKSKTKRDSKLRTYGFHSSVREHAAGRTYMSCSI